MTKQYPNLYAVDNNDNVVGEMQLEEILAKGYNRRAARVYVFNESGKVLIQRRSKNVMKPLMFDPSMGGHVEIGELYKEAAEREMREELGIDAAQYPLMPVTLPYVDDGFVSVVYKVTVPDDLPINFDTEEVSEILWLDPADLDQFIIDRKEECTRSLRYSWQRFRKVLTTSFNKITVVDEQDTVLEYTDLFDAAAKDAIRRVSVVFIFNESGLLLLQKRADWVVDPGLFDVSAAGHAEEGSDYKVTAQKELKEELGLSIDLKEVGLSQPTPKRQNGIFKATVPDDMDISYNPEEVGGIRWINISEMEEEMAKNPASYTVPFRDVWQLYRDKIIAA